MARFKDFDAGWAETKGEPLTVRILGGGYTLPAKVPAIVVLESMRLQREHPNGDVPPESIELIIRNLFGKERLNAWLEAGIDFDQLGDIVKWTMGQYSGQGDPEEGPEGEAMAPGTGQPTESGSTSSSPISA